MVYQTVYHLVYQGCSAPVPRGRFNKAKPQSGLPGLLWRQRGNGGSWVVSLAVPRHLQPRVVNRSGKPLTRLERTTGTDSLKLAKELYPGLLSELKQELAERAGSLLETKEMASRRLVGELYQKLAAPTAATPHQAAEQKTAQMLALAEGSSIGQLHGLMQELQELLVGLTTRGFAEAGLPLDAAELPQAVASIKTAVLEAREFQYRRQQYGFVADETELGKKLASSAYQPKPISIFDVAKSKRSRIGDRTYENLERACNRWKAIIGEESLESITSSHLNFFVRKLHLPKPEGGYGYCVDNANNEGVRIRSLIKFHNEHQKEDANRIQEPSWERIKESKAQQKERVRKDRDKATDKDDVKRLLDYAYLEHDDKFAWLFVLLIDNTTLRNTEALTLKWKDVVCQDGIWFIDLQDSKTAAGIRRLPLNSRLMKYMLPLKGADDEFIINSSWPHWKNPKDASGNFLRQARKALGIEGRINAHAFRHGAGGDLGYSQTEHIKITLMGHAGKQTDQYSRREWLELRKAVEAIGTDWTPPSVFPPPPLETRFDPGL
ncbi:tyrosine-type recombinase/integrase [Synechococcus sp. CB0101]|uniref:tyrosine-type recombinase/integrase n=1 Tax=Synechococcus sp. CB0101 TaxID=232348 RepID=UPI0002EFF58A|nr:tyrosine-type recombinase/integrase [Synechococcus sp. CB0101]